MPKRSKENSNYTAEAQQQQKIVRPQSKATGGDFIDRFGGTPIWSTPDRQARHPLGLPQPSSAPCSSLVVFFSFFEIYIAFCFAL